jgi:hypothetical protein
MIAKTFNRKMIEVILQWKDEGRLVLFAFDLLAFAFHYW